MCLYIEGLETIIKTFLKCSWEEYSLIIDSPQQQNKESKFKSIKSCYISLRVCTSLWKWFGVGILMNLKLKYVYRVIKSHCTITRLAKCILKNQKYLLFFYNTWNTVSWIAFLQLPTHNLIFCLAHLLIFKQNMQNWLQTIDKKKSLLFTQNLPKPKIGDTWSITNYGCPKIVLNNMIFWNLIWSPEIRRQIRPFLVLFKIRTCYLKKIWFGKCAVRFKCTVL